MDYVVTSRDDILLDGVSAKTCGVIVEVPPPVPMAQQRYTEYNVGKDSDFVSSDDSFACVSYRITVRRLLQPGDFRGGKFYALLATARTLQLSRNPDRYYKIAAVQSVEPSAAYRGQEIRYDIDFLLYPFAYHTKNAPVTMGSLDPDITNPGTRYSRPLYKVTHGGTGCDLVVNGAVCKIQPWTDKNGLTTYPPSPIYIDAERMVAYSLSGADMVNATKFTDGDLPFLNPGRNTAYTTGSSLEITGNWRDY